MSVVLLSRSPPVEVDALDESQHLRALPCCKRDVEGRGWGVRSEVTRDQASSSSGCTVRPSTPDLEGDGQ